MENKSSNSVPVRGGKRNVPLRGTDVGTFRRWRWPLFVASIATICGIALVLPLSITYLLPFLVMAISAIVGLGLVRSEYRDERATRTSMTTALRRRNPEDVGIVIDALGSLYPQVHHEAMDFLVEFLPQAATQHPHQFTSVRLAKLGLTLRFSHGILTRKDVPRDLVLAILDAFDAVGGDKEAKVVASLTKISKDVEICRAAERCLFAILKRMSTYHAHDSLLIPAVPEDRLLRSMEGPQHRLSDPLLWAANRPGPAETEDP